MGKKIETTNKVNKSDTYIELIRNAVGILIEVLTATFVSVCGFLYITKEGNEKLTAPVVLFLIVVAVVLSLFFYLLVRLCRIFTIDRPIAKLKGVNKRLINGEYIARMNIKGIVKGTTIGEAMEEFNLLSDSLEKDTREEIAYIRALSDEVTATNLIEKVRELTVLTDIKEGKLTGKRDTVSVSELIINALNHNDNIIKMKALHVATDIDEKVNISSNDKILKVLIDEIVGQFVEKTTEGSVTLSLTKQKPDICIKLSTTEQRDSFPNDWKAMKRAVAELGGRYEMAQEEFETFLSIYLPLK